MALPTRTSGAGVELIKSFEGFRTRATRLPDGTWIVGYGHTAGAREGLRGQARQVLLLPLVARPATVTCKSNQMKNFASG